MDNGWRTLLVISTLHRKLNSPRAQLEDFHFWGKSRHPINASMFQLPYLVLRDCTHLF